ncbi:phage tail tape measure protein [Microbacterium sp. HSID17254]|uniref:phage tail tape measure protein n=1 Tax=Microbacterium sp. HSID17254 TaxID=2419509 RepID=UPI000F87D6EF|nr:phage tail tape measure protein [Microbacterium sp. HSID17254]RUQ06683.1 phage tail tape measure protein [Microbacterium sp. HSID17254]
MLEAAQATRTVGTQAEKLAQTRESMNTVGAAGVAMGAALAAGIGVAVSKFAEFDQAMSFVAATGDDARENMDALRQAALDAGAATVFSATESANAIEEMAKAGVDAKDILGGGLKGALDLAAAGGLGVADAAGIAATALKTFKLEGSDMSHVADLLAAGAGKAMGDVSDLSQALSQGGQAAALTGLSIEETTAALAAFASQGLLGSDAGTSLKTMLLNLNPTTKKAADLVEQYNLQAFDQQGNFIGLAAYAGKLQAALGDMSAEQQSSTLKTIFGTDAYRAAAVVLGEGEEGIRNWITAVDDQGYAAETAATRLDNLMGDWEAFTGALDTAFISMGEGANGPLRFLVQALTNMVDGFNALPDWAKQAALGVGILTAGVGLLGGGALIAIPKIAALKVAMIDLNLNGTTARAGLSRFASFLGGPWGIAMAVATAAVVSFNAAVAEGQPKQEELLNSIATSTDSMESFKTAFSRGGLESNLFGDYAEELKDLPGLLDRAADAQWRWADLSFSEQGALDSIKRYGDALAELSQTDLPAAQAEFKALAESFDLTPESTRKLLDEMPALKSALLDQATAANIAEDSSEFLNLAMGESEQVTQTAADAYMEQASQVEDLNSQLMQLIDSMNEANGVGQDAVSSNIRYQETLAAVNEAIANGAIGLDVSTAAGRANMEMLVGLASDSQAAAAAQFELDGSTEAYTARMREGREALINSAMQMGATRDQAVALADKVYAIPTERQIKVLADTSQAHAGLDGILGRLNEAVRTHFNIPVSTVGVGTVLKPAGNAEGGVYSGGVKAFAGGGVEPGIYPYTSGGLHKFAEEYDEAYISMDPKRRTRSYGVWVEAGERFGFQQPQQQAPVQVSLAGAVMTLMVDGNPVRAVVQEQIVAYDGARERVSSRGVRA